MRSNYFLICFIHKYIIKHRTIITWEAYILFIFASIINSKSVSVTAGDGSHKKEPFPCPLVNQPSGFKMSKSVLHQDLIHPSSSIDISKDPKFRWISFKGYMHCIMQNQISYHQCHISGGQLPVSQPLYSTLEATPMQLTSPAILSLYLNVVPLPHTQDPFPPSLSCPILHQRGFPKGNWWETSVLTHLSHISIRIQSDESL